MKRNMGRANFAYRDASSPLRRIRISDHDGGKCGNDPSMWQLYKNCHALQTPQNNHKWEKLTTYPNPPRQLVHI